VRLLPIQAQKVLSVVQPDQDRVGTRGCATKNDGMPIFKGRKNA